MTRSDLGSLAALLLALCAGVCGSIALTATNPGLPTSAGITAVMAMVLAAGLWARSRRAKPPPRTEKAPVNPAPSTDSDRVLANLAAGLAHELGQPLSAARVGIEGIHYLRQLGRDPSPEHLQRTLSRVGMSLLAMTQTIEHLKSMARTDLAPALESVDLGRLIEGLLAERDQWLRYRDAHIEWRRPTQAVTALADAAGVRLVLTNLLRNAVEAVEGQGAERRLVRVTLGTRGQIAVHDSGPGIPADRLASLFDPFNSTKDGPSRGIGLSLAKASAERMGARLEVSSQPGSGTSFTLILRPAIAEPGS